MPSLSAKDSLSGLELFKTLYGLPYVVQTDDSGSFAGCFSEYLAATNTTHNISPAYHPEGQARGERQHAVAWDKLRAALPNGNFKHWDTMTPFIIESINTSYNRGIMMSPYEALYGRQARMVADQSFFSKQNFTNYSIEDYHQTLEVLRGQIITRDLARSFVQRDDIAHERGTAPKFANGDNVVLWFPTRETKAHSFWKPGYVVLHEDSPDFYMLGKREPDGSIANYKVVPAKRLRAFDASRTPDFGLSMDVKDDHGIVESIVSHRRDGSSGDYSFFVKWAGREGATSISKAELPTLMRNCKDSMRAYCKSKKIAWAHLMDQRKRQNAQEHGDAAE